MAYSVQAYRPSEIFNRRRERHQPGIHALDRRVKRVYSDYRLRHFNGTPLSSREITIRINNSSIGNLLSLITSEMSFNTYHITAAITRTCNISKNRGNHINESLVWSKLINRLFLMLNDPSLHFEKRSLCNILYAISNKVKREQVNLTGEEIIVFKNIAYILEKQLTNPNEEFSILDLSTIIKTFSIAKEKSSKIFATKSSEEEFFKVVTNKIKKKDIGSLKPRDLSEMAFAVAKLKNDFGILEKISDELRPNEHESKLKYFNALDLNFLAQAFHIARRNDHYILENIAKEIHSRSESSEGLRDFSPNSLSFLAWAFYNANKNPYDLFKKLAEEIYFKATSNIDGLVDIDLEQLSWLSMAFAGMGRNDCYIFELINLEINRRSKSEIGLKELYPDKLSMLTQAFNLAKLDDHQIFENVAFEINRRSKRSIGLRKFAPDVLANIAWAFYNENKNPYNILNKIAEEIPQRFDELGTLIDFTPEELTKLISLSSYNDNIHKIIAIEISRRYKELGSLNNFSPEALSISILFFSELNNSGNFTKTLEILESEINERIDRSYSLEDFTPSELSKIAKALSIRRNYSLFEKFVFSLKVRYNLNQFSDFDCENLAILADACVLVKNDKEIFSYIANVIIHKDLKNIKSNYLVSILNSFYLAEQDYGIYECICKEIRKRKRANNLAYFSLHDLAMLVVIFSLDEKYFRIYEDIAYVINQKSKNPNELNSFESADIVNFAKIYSQKNIKSYEIFKHLATAINLKKKENGLRCYNHVDLIKLLRAFSFSNKDHGVFEDISYAICEIGKENSLCHFTPLELILLSKTFSFSSKDFGVFQEIAFAIRKRKEQNLLCYFKPNELSALFVSFSILEKDYGLIGDIVDEIRERIQSPRELSKFRPIDLAHLAKRLSSLHEYEIAEILIREFFNREIDIAQNSKPITLIYFATVQWIIAKKIAKIPNEWLEKFKERNNHTLPVTSSSTFEDSVKNVLIKMGISNHFNSESTIFFNINGTRLKLFQVDFLDSERKLIIEVDGPNHALKKGADLARDFILKNLGYTVVRVTSEEWNKRDDLEKEEYLKSLIL